MITQGSLTNVSCAGANDGAATVSITSGTSPYSYSWSNGDTTQNLSGVGGGSYTLTVTDAANCVSTFSVTINEPTALSATIADFPAAGTEISLQDYIFNDELY